ncbi:ArsR/SmtB family transcription factor [Microbacterium sp. GXS0129]|uniref:ArsR/SmtB family transcription factor n=1 Tax=Microbacterium sp. GXS0129 TaxID=3377836 RepID=UPI00383B6FCF
MTTVETGTCCAPAAVAMSDDQAERTARLFKALGDPVRIKLLGLISASEGQEACICDLTAPVGLTQGTVSHHMKILTEAGFVSREQRGKWAYFSIGDSGFTAAHAALIR